MIDNKLTYQQAKRLREQSLSSVFADQLIMGEGYGSGIAKTISLKLRSKITGIKQKFDPLNIAKFLTGGSRLGPAILGKMLGRSRRDIEFFTGRARPVTSRTKQIGALPSGEDTTGMSAILNDVLTFLQKSHEDDMILREKENNLREGQMHEEEKRHKELLKALSVKGGKKGTATVVNAKAEGGGMAGLLNSITAMLADIKAMAQSAIDDLKSFKNFLGGAKGLAWLAGFLLNPVAWIAAAIAALVGINASIKADIEKDPYDPKYKNHPYAKFLRGETTNVNEKNATAQRASKKVGTALWGEIQQAVDSSLSDEELKQSYEADRPQLLAWLKDNPPSTMFKIGESVVNNNAGDTNVDVDNSVNNAETLKLQRQNDMAPPPPVIPPPASAQVTTRTNENRQVEMDERLNRLTKSTEQTRTASGKLLKPDGKPRFKPPIIAVRNVEPTFRNVIYNSTRIV